MWPVDSLGCCGIILRTCLKTVSGLTMPWSHGTKTWRAWSDLLIPTSTRSSQIFNESRFGLRRRFKCCALDTKQDDRRELLWGEETDALNSWRMTTSLGTKHSWNCWKHAHTRSTFSVSFSLHVQRERPGSLTWNREREWERERENACPNNMISDFYAHAVV